MEQSTAIHEAGHVIMAILLGVPWRSATIEPLVIEGRTAEGVVYFLKPENTNDLIRVLLAGYAAEQVVGLPISYGSRCEYQECQELAKQTDEEPNSWTDALLWQVTGKLREHKEQLMKLASFLEWMGSISPETMDIVKHEINFN